jgi:hypothetical protein
LLTQLRAWRVVGEKIILFIDVNKNVYTGSLAKALRGKGLLIEEQTLWSTWKEVPHSHCTGKVVRVGMYAPPEIICTNSHLSLHGTGVGNHWFQLLTLMIIQFLAQIIPKQFVSMEEHSAAG